MNTVGVVLAAGFGTRLRPSTDHMPKPLIPVAGVEPLFFALDSFYRAGIRRVIVNAHHLASQVQAAVVEWMPLLPGLEIRCQVEGREILGTGGGLINIIQSNSDWFKDAGLIVQNGDTLASFDLAKMLVPTDKCLFAISQKPEHLKKYNPLWISASGAWSGIGKTPPTPGDIPAHFLGVHYLSPTSVALLSGHDFTGEASDLFNAIYRPLTDRQFAIERVEFFETEDGADFWFDMTTQIFLLEAQKYLLGTAALKTHWGQLLGRRYPGIREAKLGVWMLGDNTDWVNRAVAPVVMIAQKNGSGGSSHLGMSTLIGPNATIVVQAAPMNALPRSVVNAVAVLNGGTNALASVVVENQVIVG